ncbi:MAG: acyl-CoA thioesterase [Alistipes sp.]|nr:acyl-CoA thioesterase [Alistipes sp.]MBQ5829005.1 acyl-CoA thioesterase [Alistipes sp.]MBR2110673.1 acyl-CoA thioesterase [Alistipes sp.]MBR3590171.1 acyl-CoA thioesterase [Alistipes sp.]MBR3892771.1 acyl-CoA thioesterase [Alistipes sp.]
MAKQLITPVQKRFSDVDSFMHVNNIWQQSYFDMGKTDFYVKVLGIPGVFDRMRIITASTHTDYLGQVRLMDDIVVTTDVSRLGNKSMTLHQRIMAGDKCLTESSSVMVAFDFELQQTVPLPEEWRERLSEYLTNDSNIK